MADPSFQFTGTLPDARPITGTLAAADEPSARAQLASMGVSVASLSPMPSTSPPPLPPPDASRPQPVRAISGYDLQAFNQNLAALATSGLPLEQGLRLAASEARSKSVRRAIDQLALDLESGTPLATAFERQRGVFPSVYSRLATAAIATGTLPAMLLSLGRHQQTSQRLRSTLHRSAFYPLIVITALAVVAAFTAHFVLPQMADMMTQFGNFRAPANPWRARTPPVAIGVPAPTAAVIAAGPYVPLVALLLAGSLLLIPPLTFLLRRSGWDVRLADALVLRLPLIGSALRFSALGRFTEILAISTRSGLNLPDGARLAAGTVGYPRLIADADSLATAIESGQSPNSVAPLRLLPQTLLSALASASQTAALPGTLDALAELYREQAELRASRIPIVLLPVLLLIIALLVAALLAAVVLPIVHLMRFIT
jgi:type II secretory pathway component PulF